MHCIVLSGNEETAIRLGAALILGGMLGLDRELHGKPAGLRTYALVSLGAAVATIVVLESPNHSLAIDPNAIGRVVQGILTTARECSPPPRQRGSQDSYAVIIREICSRHVVSGPCEHAVCAASQKRLPVATYHASAFRSRVCHRNHVCVFVWTWRNLGELPRFYNRPVRATCRQTGETAGRSGLVEDSFIRRVETPPSPTSLASSVWSRG
jgi:hypothetical protein